MELRPWPGIPYKWRSSYRDPNLLQEVEDWLKKECKDDWRFSFYGLLDTGVVFVSQEDAINFALTWSQ